MNKISLLLVLTVLLSCTNKNIPNEIQTSEKTTGGKIAMQRVVDSEPKAKQELVNRDAMQLALLERLNEREQELNQKFLETSQTQQDMFLQAHADNVERLEMISEGMESIGREIGRNITELKNINDEFKMHATEVGVNAEKQAYYFKDMKKSYEEKLAFDKELIKRETERENSIRGIVEDMYKDQDTALRQFYTSTKEGMLPPREWVDLEDAPVTIHEDNKKFEDVITKALNMAAVHSGPWQLKWKFKKENEILLYTKFSLDAETNFGDLVSRIRGYVLNYNGVNLKFTIFKNKRVLIVSDT